MSLNKKNVLEAIKAAKGQTKKTKFVQSIDLVMVLRGINPKKAEERIKVDVELPHGAVKGKRVCVFAHGDLATKAKKGGADKILDKTALQKISADKKAAKKLATGYDYFIADRSVMPIVARSLGRFLGPRDKMPLVVSSSDPIDSLVKSYKKTMRIKMKDQPVLQCVVGTEEMSDDDISKNVQAVVDKVVERLKRKMGNVKAIYIKKTMGKPVRVVL